MGKSLAEVAFDAYVKEMGPVSLDPRWPDVQPGSWSKAPEKVKLAFIAVAEAIKDSINSKSGPKLYDVSY